MSRPPFGEEKEVTICDDCGDTVVLPPGIYYRGERLHKHCALLRMQQDFSIEQAEPYLEHVEDSIESLFENMRPMSEG